MTALRFLPIPFALALWSVGCTPTPVTTPLDASTDSGPAPVDGGPPVDAGPPPSGELSTVLTPQQTPEYYVAQANLYFDTLDTRADPALVPNYSTLVARWEWAPWLLLTGYERDVMVNSTRTALAAEPSTVPTRDCRAFAVQPFARCRVSFAYRGGACAIYEEFTFNDQGETTFIEAWSDLPGMRATEDPADPWAEGAGVHRLSTRVPGLGNETGLIDPLGPWMQAAARTDPELADFAARTQTIWESWLQISRERGPDYFALGCGW